MPRHLRVMGIDLERALSDCRGRLSPSLPKIAARFLRAAGFPGSAA